MTERQQKLINSIGLRGRLTSDIAAEERADLETLVEAGYIVPHTIELRETGTGGTDHEGIPEWILTDKGKFAITDDE